MLQLAAVIFLTISGGPYGLEPLLKSVGTGGALMLLILTPILWDIPTILTVLELNSMMPVTGGYYQWVKRALGLRFAWYEGLWTWLYTFVDLAIYPVLFVGYISYFYPEAQQFKIHICLLIIWSSALLNIRGVVPVGKVSQFLGALILSPFLVMLVVLMMTHQGSFTVPLPSFNGLGIPALGLGFYTIMWNFLGWDNVTTYAEEVTSPVKSYYTSVFTAFFSIIAIYAITIFIASQSGINYEYLENAGFPALGQLIGGNVLGAFVAIGGMAGTLGLYSGVLLSVSRVPKVMADDNLLPEQLHREHKSYGTPYVSIITCSVVVSAMCFLDFKELLIMDVIVYGAALFLEFITLIVMRKYYPNENRPFRIPLGTKALWLMILAPLGVYAIALIGTIMGEQSESTQVFTTVGIAIGALLMGEVLWRVIIWRQPHLKEQAHAKHEPV